jgi:uridylate kinase
VNSSNLPISSPYRSKPDAPVTEAEREQLSSRLNAAFTDGKLEQDDYQIRLDQLFAATRMGQLLPVVEGLPPMPTHANPEIVASGGGEPGQLTDTRSASRFALLLIAVLVVAIVLIAMLFVVVL